jgi:hypothetical protein
MKMNSKIHRCGYCGQPVDKNGNPLEGKARQRVISIIETYGDYHTEKEHGECCVYDEMMRQEQQTYVRVTRDMAIDAGMPEIEGTKIPW